jgi:putative transposon-encoded protein
MAVTRTKREIASLTGTVTKQGNGAHIMVPKEWLGIEVKVIPVSYIQNKMSEQDVKDTGAAVWDAVKGVHKKRKK